MYKRQVEKSKDIIKRQSVLTMGTADSFGGELDDSVRQAMVPSSPSRHPMTSAEQGLEYQTLKASLTHATQTIAKLRQQIIRMKADKTFDRSGDSPRTNRPALRTPKAKRKAFTFADPPSGSLTPTFKNASYTIHEGSVFMSDKDDDSDDDTFDVNDGLDQATTCLLYTSRCV